MAILAMAILEMIPPVYWRRLKKELSRLNLDKIPETALPNKHPDGKSTAIQYEETMDAIIRERSKRLVNSLKKKIQEKEWVIGEQKERIGELELLLEEEIRRRENVEETLGKEVHENFEREQKLMRELANVRNLTFSGEQGEEQPIEDE